MNKLGLHACDPIFNPNARNRQVWRPVVPVIPDAEAGGSVSVCSGLAWSNTVGILRKTKVRKEWKVMQKTEGKAAFLCSLLP